MRSSAPPRRHAVLLGAVINTLLVPVSALGGLSCAPKTSTPVAELAPPPPSPPPPPSQGVESQGMRLEWRVVGDQLRCSMSAPTSGWVRVGFNTVRAQHLANMIVGWVDAAGAHVEDRYAVDPPQIDPDLALGGRDDAVLVSGKEEGGRTTVEFTLPLDSGDPYDLALSPGQSIFVVLSYGDSDDRSQPSVVRTAVPITL